MRTIQKASLFQNGFAALECFRLAYVLISSAPQRLRYEADVNVKVSKNLAQGQAFHMVVRMRHQISHTAIGRRKSTVALIETTERGRVKGPSGLNRLGHSQTHP
ncbi:MAG: hypothetical protein ACXWVT_06375, partial [Burkholderiaceae bacterium]